MRSLVIYDSYFGNTESIAQSLANALGPHEAVEVLRASLVKQEHLMGLTLLLDGSPTRGFQPSSATNLLLRGLAPGSLGGVRVAAFDTRLSPGIVQKTPVLPVFVRIFGYAAKPVSARLLKAGGQVVLPPEGFSVEAVEGPLSAGELERAATWAAQILDVP